MLPLLTIYLFPCPLLSLYISFPVPFPLFIFLSPASSLTNYFFSVLCPLLWYCPGLYLWEDFENVFVFCGIYVWGSLFRSLGWVFVGAPGYYLMLCFFRCLHAIDEFKPPLNFICICWYILNYHLCRSSHSFLYNRIPHEKVII